MFIFLFDYEVVMNFSISAEISEMRIYLISKCIEIPEWKKNWFGYVLFIGVSDYLEF